MLPCKHYNYVAILIISYCNWILNIQFLLNEHLWFSFLMRRKKQKQYWQTSIMVQPTMQQQQQHTGQGYVEKTYTFLNHFPVLSSSSQSHSPNTFWSSSFIKVIILHPTKNTPHKWKQNLTIRLALKFQFSRGWAWSMSLCITIN